VLFLLSGILIIGSIVIEGRRVGPGKSCFKGAFPEIMMLYVINVTENVIRIVKNMFPQPIFLFFLFLQLVLVLIHVKKKKKKKKKNYEAAMCVESGNTLKSRLQFLSSIINCSLIK
jgi:hypothetical protein